MTNFERLIAALDKEYADRHEGDVKYSINVDRGRNSVFVFVSDTPSDDCPARYINHYSPLASHETTAQAIEICAQKILKQMGVASE